MGEALIRELEGMATVLDVGCGEGGPLLRLPKPPRLVGLDAHAPSLEKLRSGGFYDEAMLWEAGKDPFPPASFEAVLGLDVIEHMPKEQALALVTRMEGWARRKVILATPNGFLPQAPYGDNPYQAHLCGFTPEELRALGYRIYGLNGPKPFRGERGEVRWRPKPLWYRVAGLLQGLTWRWPSLAFSLLAVKDVAP